MNTKLIIGIIILILMLLTSCRIYDLANFVIPDDPKFLAVVESLNTPRKISEYMIEHFEYILNLWSAYSPYKLWLLNMLTKYGDCNDMSCFGHWVANWHGIETYQIEIKLKNSFKTHWLAVYVEDKYSFTDNQFYFYGYDTFQEMVEKSCRDNICWEWTSYKVYDYDMNIIDINKK